MKKNLLVLMLGVAVISFFAGCGKTEILSDAINKEAVKPLTDSAGTQKEASTKDAVEGDLTGIGDYAAAQQKIIENYDENDPEATAKMMESYAELEGQMALDEFEKTESVDAPSDFPSSLIYSKGKITESSDSGDESYINKSITIETTEDFKAVKDFYKNLFSQTPWKLTSQSSESDSASYDATDAADIGVNVYISFDSYSKIVNISISYSGSVAE